MKTPSIRPIHDDIAVVGWACRLPGANSIDELWTLLMEERCAITTVPDDRFSLERFGHPRRQERGKSYTWAAGVLDDIWSFDPAVFGISPREAVQIDPQQRILLQLTWEALEDAGIPPSSVAGSEVGVFVGASQADYGHSFFGDPAIADSHFATGTAIAILANRISYIFGLHGPSFTVDTACSSSLVALHQAMQALRSGRIDTAIVGGCNLVASPASFIAFSQANMLSPTGQCRAFSAAADGFVRAEGAAVLVLRKTALAQQNPVHGMVIASDVNSDGRTNGMALPSLDAQQALLSRIYERGGIDANRLAFVEAHGTGTPVGDPIEATAIGRILGQRRSAPLPIGSVKTNVGHLEPASGLVGVLKALLALNHGLLPPSLNFDEPNPNIPFDELNLSVCTQPLLLPHAAEQYAGVNSFGFGGTNSHVVVGAGRKAVPPAESDYSDGLDVFTISANSTPALQALAREYRGRVAHQSDRQTAITASAIIHRREPQMHRLVISSTRTSEVARALDAYLTGAEDRKLTIGTAVGRDLPVAFVFSGNGGQQVGMGRAAHRNNASFRNRFEEIDSYFREIAGWSLTEALFSDTLHERLPLTSVAQPLIFAIQASSTAALAAAGLEPAVVLGHSVGEVAAAEAAGALDLRTAVKVIHFRSAHQESCRGAGRMAAVLASPDVVQALIDAGAGEISIAAINGPRTVTIAGSGEALAAFKQMAKTRGIAQLDLGLDYPFHTARMDAIRAPLENDLREIRCHDSAVPFVSTVTGACLAGSRLNGHYWWRNVREPVRFTAAIRAAAELGARYFVEVGPRGVLAQHIVDSLKGEVSGVATYVPLGRTGHGNNADQNADDDTDPFASACAHAMVTGAQLALSAVFGPNPGPGVALPQYPWQNSPFRFKPTVEAVDGEAERQPHPFAGMRSRRDALEWRGQVDSARLPALSDHKLGEQTIFPGTGFVEMSLAVGRQWLEAERVTLSRFEILNPLDLSAGVTREILTRISPSSSTLEILSRPRLSDAGWLLHCRGKVLAATNGTAPDAPTQDRTLPRDPRVFEQAELYGIAEASGLHYGPAFRLVQRVAVDRDGVIDVALSAPAVAGPDANRFELDPMRLDASAHGFFALFPELRAVERGVTYIPVRLEEVSLFRPKMAPHRAQIVITSKSERSIVGDCYLYGAGDELVAVLRGVRSQAIPTRRTSGLEHVAFVELTRLCDGAILGATGVGADVASIMAAADAGGLTVNAADAGAAANDAGMLLEGWAIAQAHEIASALATNDRLDVDALAASGRIPERALPWFASIMGGLSAAHLARRQAGVWQLVHDSALPSADAVLATIAREQPSRAGETLLAAAAARAARTLAQSVAAGTTIGTPEIAIPKAVLDFHFATSVPLQALSDALVQLLTRQTQLWPDTRSLRVLQVGAAPLAQRLLEARRDVQLTVLEPDRRRYASAELALARQPRVSLVDAEQTERLGEFDLIISAAGLHRLPANLGVNDLQQRLAPGGLLVALEPRASLFKDIVFGLDPDWFRAGSADRPTSGLVSSEKWHAALEDGGFADAAAVNVRCGGEAASLLVATTERSTHSTHAETDADADAELVIHLPEGDDDTSDPLDPASALTRRCLAIRACATGIGDQPATLWLVFSGALAIGSARVCAVETGAWAFSRTLANEFPNLDVRRIDFTTSVTRRDASAVEALVRRIATSGTAETELHTDGQSVHAVRVTGLRTALRAIPSSRRVAARLERRSGGGERVAWQPVERNAPRVGEVEIEVEATGLNFRDVMWSMSLLPEDMLEHGFSGPTLGLECAGRVVRVGRDVTDLEVGDRVMAFAASSFANYVTVAVDQAVRVPAALSCEAAATIPVAFFTAYYALVTQAQLKRREWVLIHGGAGAVGLAAIQVAQARGAKVIATAGSPAKRELLGALGVAHVLDSRSTAFVDEIRRLTGEGVDVVLNSLAGEAMERSISCLRPFGRFVELGKRDYVSDTQVGLRPFRRNLSYFGVDVDQVISARKALGKRVFAKIIGEFEKGTYRPLPFSVFEADGVATAFHLLQQAGHIGKVVVRPPRNGVPTTAGKPFQVSRTGTHVVTGAFGGFGIETAKWLVEKGARYLVMVGRSGAASADAQSVVRDFAARGVQVLAKACDVTDRRALEQLFEVIHSTMPVVAGVVHAAMVLDDGILTNLDADRFYSVLGPKITGAENLDQMLRGAPLDYFVLYSSVTTLIGNPGQANYVAANAYMEGLARRRRLAGQPALAIGWGPISDVGVLAKQSRLKAGLERLTGSEGLRARDALDLMEQALSLSPEPVETAVITIAASDSSFTVDRLPVLRSPTYEAFVGDRRAGTGEGGVVDLRAIAATRGVDAARRKATEVIGAQVALVLQLSAEDVSPVRPLGEIGLDSLMALELVLNLEELFGLKIPLTGASGGVSVADIADRIVAQIGLGRDQPDSVVATLASQHHGDVAREQMAALEEIAERGAQPATPLKVRILP